MLLYIKCEARPVAAAAAVRKVVVSAGRRIAVAVAIATTNNSVAGVVGR